MDIDKLREEIEYDEGNVQILRPSWITNFW